METFLDNFIAFSIENKGKFVPAALWKIMNKTAYALHLYKRRLCKLIYYLWRTGSNLWLT